MVLPSDFLGDQDTPRRSSSNLNERDEEAEEQSVEDPHADMEQSVEETQPIQPTAHEISNSPEQDSIRSSTPKKKSPARPCLEQKYSMNLPLTCSAFIALF